MNASSHPPLTLERMRTDIARVLHEADHQIGLHDNLMDLGLDSMRAMSLVSLWSRNGIAYDFSEFAARPTLAGWWDVVSQKQINGSPTQ